MSSFQPPMGISKQPVTQAKANVSIVARSMDLGEISPDATARRGPTRSELSLPFL